MNQLTFTNVYTGISIWSPSALEGFATTWGITGDLLLIVSDEAFYALFRAQNPDLLVKPTGVLEFHFAKCSVMVSRTS